jgi:hypothetical protein
MNYQEYNKEIINVTINEMTKIYLMFCLPFVIIDEKGHIVDSGYRWQNQEAENCYSAYQNLLYELQKSSEVSLNLPLKTYEDKQG